jgi:hypothetical protein
LIYVQIKWFRVFVKEFLPPVSITGQLRDLIHSVLFKQFAGRIACLAIFPVLFLAPVLDNVLFGPFLYIDTPM